MKSLSALLPTVLIATLYFLLAAFVNIAAGQTTTPATAPSFPVYYVSNTATNGYAIGKDTNAGTSPSAPLLTFQAAANKITGPTTVSGNPGTYAAGFVLSWNQAQAGTAANPIVFQADPNVCAYPATSSADPYGAPTPSIIITGRNNETAIAIDGEPGSDHVIIRGFTIQNPAGTITKAGIKMTGNEDQILNNTVTGAAGIGGIFTDNANDAIVRYNEVSGTIGTNTTGHGMYFSGTCAGVDVEFNYIHDNGYHGIHLNGDASEGGIGEVTNATVANNFIINNPGNGINADGLVNSTIANNVITGFTKYAISSYTSDAGVPSTGNLIVNNTSNGPNIGEFQNGASATLFNNVFMGSAIQTDGTGKLTESNNILGSATAAATFQSASANNFQLLSTSAAIGMGLKTFNGFTAPTTDILGNGQPSGKIDAGALQSNGLVPGNTAMPTPHPAVDFNDMQILSAHYNQKGTTWQTADFNGDGITNYADFQILNAHFGQPQRPYPILK